MLQLDVLENGKHVTNPLESDTLTRSSAARGPLVITGELKSKVDSI